MRAKAQAVLADTSVFRRLPVQVMQCDPDMYLFLVEHPDVVVNIWQVLGVSELSLTETGPATFQIAEDAGAQGTMKLLYSSHDTHVFYAEGQCEGPFAAKPIQGRVVAVLKSGYVRETNGRYYITCRLDAFLQVDRVGVEFMTKTLQPLVGRVADLNFAQTANFISSLSRTTERNLDGMLRLTTKLSDVQPTVRDRFAQLAHQVSEKASELPDDPDARVADQRVGLTPR